MQPHEPETPGRPPTGATGATGSETEAGTGSGSDTADVRLGALSLRARLVVAGALAVLAVYTLWHLTMVFLFVAPDNTASNDHREVLDDYIYPEFEQSWQLFAPNPLQRNTDLQVRAELREDGSVTTTDWISLTAMDIERIEHNLFPSHTAQNELRRAWDFFVDSHDEQGGPEGLRGELSETYLTRIGMLRLDQQSEVEMDVADVSRVQFRSATQLVAAPPWSEEQTDTSTSYYELDWWVVNTGHLPGATLAQGGPEPEPALAPEPAPGREDAAR